MRTTSILGEAAQSDNFRNELLHDEPTIATPTEPWAILVTSVVVLVTWLVVLALISVFKYTAGYDTGSTWAVAQVVWLFALPVTLVVVSGVMVWERVVKVRTQVQRAQLVRDRHKNPVSARLMGTLSMEQYMAQYTAAGYNELAMRTVQPYGSGVDSLSMHSTSTKDSAPVTDSGSVNTLTFDELLPKLMNDSEPHLLLGGKSGSGKTTLGRAIAYGKGMQVVVLDPHGSEWEGASVVDDYNDIESTLTRLLSVLDTRIEQYKAGTRSFVPVAIFVDEVPGVRDECPSFDTFMKKSGSQMRKVSMHVMLLTQSALVKDIGGSTALNSNFTKFALTLPAISQLLNNNAALSREQRSAVIDKVKSVKYPCVVELAGDIVIVDRSGTNTATGTLVPFQMGTSTVKSTDKDQTDRENLVRLVNLVLDGNTREKCRAVMPFNNDTYTEALRLASLYRKQMKDK